MSDLVIALRRMAEEYTTGRIRSYSALSLNHQVAAETSAAADRIERLEALCKTTVEYIESGDSDLVLPALKAELDRANNKETQ